MNALARLPRLTLTSTVELASGHTQVAHKNLDGSRQKWSALIQPQQRTVSTVNFIEQSNSLGLCFPPSQGCAPQQSIEFDQIKSVSSSTVGRAGDIQSDEEHEEEEASDEEEDDEDEGEDEDEEHSESEAHFCESSSQKRELSEAHLSNSGKLEECDPLAQLISSTIGDIMLEIATPQEQSIAEDEKRSA